MRWANKHSSALVPFTSRCHHEGLIILFRLVREYMGPRSRCTGLRSSLQHLHQKITWHQEECINKSEENIAGTREYSIYHEPPLDPQHQTNATMAYRRAAQRSTLVAPRHQVPPEYRGSWKTVGPAPPSSNPWSHPVRLEQFLPRDEKRR